MRTRTVWVIFNGEIYNFRELRDELETRDIDLRRIRIRRSLLMLMRNMGKSVSRDLTECLPLESGMKIESDLFLRGTVWEKNLFIIAF